MENELDTQESVNLEEEETTLESDEVVEEGNEELDKAKSAFNDQKIRAEKAEKELKKLKANKPVEKQEKALDSNYSLSDIRALNDVHDDDVSEVQEYANFKGISIAEAKKDPVVQNILKARVEERTTANATNTGKGTRGSKNLSNEQVVEAMESGKEVDPAKYAEAKLALRKAKVQE